MTLKVPKTPKRPKVPLPFQWMTLDTGDASAQLPGVIENLRAQGYAQVQSIPWTFGRQPGFIVLFAK